VYGTKPRTLQDLKHEIAIACAAMPPATIKTYEYATLFNTTVNISLVLVLVILNICDFKVTNTTMGQYLSAAFVKIC
jgi:hypothetical protein